ncbi:MAG TPA: tRNA lysidine(34) synthetase TilS [Holophagaceae bacterium]|nr:tRNA lysidine(34) synthetase TilS [Holophagaceae bacterium]
MNRFEADLLAELRRRGDGVSGARVLVACSGGGDSTALLALLGALRKSLELDLVVAHADHGLREGAGEDAEFVRALCRAWDLDLVETTLGVKAHAEGRGMGLEMAARELRWAFLRAEAESCGAAVVATGHTLDDHTETVFLRLQRGSGLGCLTPLPPRQDLRWSPLVGLRRAQLRDYLRSRSIPWREDPTNSEPFTPRNRLRPLLEGLRAEMPHLDAHLMETHRQAAEGAALGDRWMRLGLAGAWSLGPGGLTLARRGWDAAELGWLLAEAWPDLGSDAVRDLAAWAVEVLSAKGGNRGGWKLHPMDTGWLLSPPGTPAEG